MVVAQNDHYFNNNAEVWWWNTGGDRWVYVRATELRGRHDCGNNSYTLILHSFPGGSFAPAPSPTPTLPFTPTLIFTDTLTPTVTPTPGG